MRGPTPLWIPGSFLLEPPHQIRFRKTMPVKDLCARAAHLKTKISSKRRTVRQTIDTAISVTGASIVSNSTSQIAFYRLASCLRAHPTLLAPKHLSHPDGLKQIRTVIEVCYNLARNHSRWKRQPESWPILYSDSNAQQPIYPEQSTGLSAGHSIRDLIDHLLTTKNRPPAFMYRCWFGTNNGNRTRQKLFMHVAAGNSIRGTKYGDSLTKKMAARLYSVPADSSFASAEHQARSGRPPVRSFRIPRIMTRRRRKAWEINPGLCNDIYWKPIDIRDFYHHEKVIGPPVKERTWIISQLTCRNELILEGKRLRHCVGSYWDSCLKAITSIWSMETRDILRNRALVTIEVLPKSREIWQIRGFCNRLPRKREIEIIRKWAEKESLSMGKWEDK